MAEDHRQLDAVLPSLRCTVCAGELVRTGGRVNCVAGHGYDIAKQGYLNLAVGHRAGTADTSEMVAARAGFLARGHYRPIASAVGELGASVSAPGLVLDLAGGTGYYLAATLEVAPGRAGVCVDLSAPALRRAARAHPRAAALGADAWQRLPLADAAAGVVLSIFGPRDPAEIRRVLAPGGVLIAVSPESTHLRELVEPLGLIGVDPRKGERQAASFEGFEAVDERAVECRLSLSRAELVEVAAMGPSAWHVTRDTLERRSARLPEPMAVSLAVRVTAYR